MIDSIYKPITDEMKNLRDEYSDLIDIKQKLENKITIIGEHIVNLENRLDEELNDIRSDIDLLKQKTLTDVES